MNRPPEYVTFATPELAAACALLAQQKLGLTVETNVTVGMLSESGQQTLRFYSSGVTWYSSQPCDFRVKSVAEFKNLLESKTREWKIGCRTVTVSKDDRAVTVWYDNEHEQDVSLETLVEMCDEIRKQHP